MVRTTTDKQKSTTFQELFKDITNFEVQDLFNDSAFFDPLLNISLAKTLNEVM